MISSVGWVHITKGGIYRHGYRSKDYRKNQKSTNEKISVIIHFVKMIDR